MVPRTRVLEALIAELTAPTYTFTSTGKMESKADMKKRGMRSPDLAKTLTTDSHPHECAVSEVLTPDTVLIRRAYT